MSPVPYDQFVGDDCDEPGGIIGQVSGQLSFSEDQGENDGADDKFACRRNVTPFPKNIPAARGR